MDGVILLLELLSMLSFSTSIVEPSSLNNCLTLVGECSMLSSSSISPLFLKTKINVL